MKLNTNSYGTIHKSMGIIAAILIVIILASCQDGQVTTTTQPPGSTGLPLVVFSSNDFAGSGNCAICHTNLTDAVGSDVSIDSHWRSTMMANAAKDPFWQAKVASEVDRNPQLKEVIEDKCTSCHMPMAYTQANVEGLPTLILDDGFLNPTNILNEVAMDGNSCTLCHQIVDPVLGEYHIDTDTEPPDRLIYGPFENQQQSLMMSVSAYKPVFGEHTEQSLLCGTCH